MLRVLPAILLLLLAFLPARVGLVWQSAMNAANAEEAAPAEHTEAKAGEHGTAAAEEPVAQTGAVMPAPESNTGDGLDLQAITKSDYEVLQQLAKRRTELEQREKDLADRAAMLEAVQQQVATKADEQQKLKAELDKLSAGREDAGEAKFRRLVKIYETMKPEEAARILERMEARILLEVVARMSERRLAPILAQMDPGKAQAITVAMAQRPDPAEAAATGADAAQQAAAPANP
jgi:flagellar motility protein MotE (MotC chaperone)